MKDNFSFKMQILGYADILVEKFNMADILCIL